MRLPGRAGGASAWAAHPVSRAYLGGHRLGGQVADQVGLAARVDGGLLDPLERRRVAERLVARFNGAKLQPRRRK